MQTLEPQANAKVVLKTNFGDLELELWGQQTPLTTRNFLQLCYDGYYNGTVFHRLVPGFILQGGDPTGTGHGGEAIYPGGLFADELHSRLKFNRRGLLGMANSGRKNDNGSQFFLTLGETKELTGKNTMFGKIVGDTIYNLVRMGELEVKENSERPLFPPKILATEVLVNPYEDIKPRETKRKAEDVVTEKPKKTLKKKKGGKAMLSFAGEEEEGPIVMPIKKKPKFDTRLVVADPESEEKVGGGEGAIRKDSPKFLKADPKGAITITTTTIEPPQPPPPRSPPAQTLKPGLRRSPSPMPSRSPTPPPSKTELLLAQTNAQIAALKKSLRRSPSPPPATASAASKKKSLLKIQKEMLPPTSVQGRKRRRGGKKGAIMDDEDGEAFAALQKFKAKLAAAPPLSGSDALYKSQERLRESSTGLEEKNKEGEDFDAEASLCDLHFIPNCQSCSAWDNALPTEGTGEEGGGGGEITDDLWSHALSFERDRLGKDLTWKKKNEQLVVIDPREKQKEILGANRNGNNNNGGNNSSPHRHHHRHHRRHGEGGHGGRS